MKNEDKKIFHEERSFLGLKDAHNVTFLFTTRLNLRVCAPTAKISGKDPPTKSRASYQRRRGQRGRCSIRWLSGADY